MIYDYQYDVAATLITSALLFIYLLRNNHSDKSNKIFLFVIIFNLIASIFDVVSCFTISFPDEFSLNFNYFISLNYLFFYNMMSVLYFAYIDAKGKIDKFKLPARLTIIISTLLYIILIFTSPKTHLIAYFDENLKYQHGPLMVLFQVLPFVMFAWEIVIFKKAKKRFNFYQVITSIFLVIGMSIAVLISIIFPKMLVGQLVMSIIMVFIYIVFENPAYYTYQDTQCLNRKAFNKTIKNIKSDYKNSFSIIIIDIKDYNYVKTKINDKSAMLLSKKIADNLYHIFKKNVYCISDNKYVIMTKEEMLHDYTERVYYLFNSPIIYEDIRYKFNVKINYIKNANLYSSKDISLLIEYADKNIDYKNSDEMLSNIKNNITKKDAIIIAIEKAIKEDKFQVFYQPIYNTNTNKYESAEALIRLIDDEIGFINPEELIITAENNGYIDKIGEIVFEKVCKFINNNNINKLGIKYIEINLSPVQCLRKDLVETYYNIMQKYEIKPNQINLEITETAQFSSDEDIYNNIKKFNKFGVKFSIDDYGSGFASANYLVKLPVNIVKIDKEILWAAMKNNNAMIILKNTIRMIKELNYEIVVEGVETKEMVDFLKKEGCDYNQGYYFSKPINEIDFLDFIKTKNEV